MTHARAAAPDHGLLCRGRRPQERPGLPEASKIVRQACHILTELGDDALTAA